MNMPDGKMGFSLVPDPKDNSTWLGAAVAVLGAIFGYDNPASSPEFVGGLIAVVGGILSIFRKKKEG
jgi:hypothetical protein